MISSRNNERLKAIRRLRGSKARAADGGVPALLLEGPHLLRAALKLGLSLDFVLAKAGFNPAEDAAKRAAGDGAGPRRRRRAASAAAAGSSARPAMATASPTNHTELI